MSSPREARYSDPVWWSVQHTVIWEQHQPALRSQFNKHTAGDRHAEIASQGPDDAVFQQRSSTPRNVDVDRAFAVPDLNWEVGTRWETIEPGLRYGVGAQLQYPSFERWTSELEARLHEDWIASNDPSTWEKVRRGVRHGFESARRPPR
jgi:hypothetical protein